ncbi:MAG TPA: putative zinc-binding metallopeptidase [Bryobacteraceae bacterium]|nr:putative zinc-binding metallopeptidase [Bryobacteraceae bacterium]
MEAPWAALPDDELLKLRLCDLHVRMEGSELEPYIARLYVELESNGLLLKPECYLGDEWFSPAGAPLIAIPFYLSHPRLKLLEMHQMLEVEGGTPEWCQQLLRHECGHAIDHAYGFSQRDRWVEVFGSPEVEYLPETYRPRPYSKSFVRHLPNWYAQAHPDEDFAETFAVWLTWPKEQWRAQYRGWKAAEKLEYVEELMQEARQTPPAVTKGRRVWDATRSRRTLQAYYAAKRKLYAEDFPDVYDDDLRAIFAKAETGDESAAQLMRRLHRPLVTAVVHWTGQHKYTVDMLVRKLIARSRELKLLAPRDHVKLMIELASYLAALVTNHLHTGRFKRSV